MDIFMIPHTSPQHYLTGMTALNIPTIDGKGGDWHFQEAFYGRNGILPKIFLAGEGEEINTNAIFADNGIFECSAILKEYGIHLLDQDKVFAANHLRAIADMVYRCIKKEIYPHHIDPEEWIDDPAQLFKLKSFISVLKPSLTFDENEILNQWLLAHL